MALPKLLSFDVQGAVFLQQLLCWCQLVNSLSRVARDFQVAAPRPFATSSAIRRTSLPVFPHCPNAIGCRVALPWTRCCLLRVAIIAVETSILSILHDVSVTKPLPTALRASAPSLPVTKLAVLWLRANAVISSTLADLRQSSIASLPPGFSLFCHPAGSLMHATTTCGAACAPCSPACKDTVHHRTISTAGGCTCPNGGVARPGLFESTHAPSSITTAILFDYPAATLNAAASPTAIRPWTPRLQNAVHSCFAIDIDIAELCLSILALYWCSTFVGFGDYGTMPDRHASTAGGRAHSPCRPATECAINASSAAASLCVAGLDLFFLLRSASPAAITWHALYHTIPRPLPSTTGTSASAPGLPVSP
mmetsp:Transcript_31660/g.57635  ORF Transcript_31660/g.57635 Transcript_31660/m.57635 type:complete len:366 (-) Transcript_31660:3428-4525(-)